MKESKLIYIFLILFIVSCSDSVNKNSPNYNNSFKLSSQKVYNIDSLDKVSCESVSIVTKDSVTLKKDLGFSFESKFLSLEDTAKKAIFTFKISIYGGLLNFAYIYLDGDFGCIKEYTKVMFVNKQEETVDYICVNDKESCTDNILLMFSMPLNTFQERMDMYKIASCDKIRIIKNDSTFIDLLINESDKAELQRKLWCFTDKIGEI